MNKSQLFSSINQHQKLQVIGPMLEDKNLISLDCPTIYVDGGAKYQVQNHLHPTYLIGDADSHPYPDQFHYLLSPDKDVSDLGFVLQNLTAQNCQLSLLGFIGGRLDHQLFVLGEVQAYSKRTGNLIILDDQLIFPAKLDQTHYLECQYTGIFSVGCYQPTTISISGAVKYPLHQIELIPHSSFGLSNQSTGSFQIKAMQNFWVYFENKQFLLGDFHE